MAIKLLSLDTIEVYVESFDCKKTYGGVYALSPDRMTSYNERWLAELKRKRPGWTDAPIKLIYPENRDLSQRLPVFTFSAELVSSWVPKDHYHGSHLYLVWLTDVDITDSLQDLFQGISQVNWKHEAKAFML